MDKVYVVLELGSISGVYSTEKQALEEAETHNPLIEVYEIQRKKKARPTREEVKKHFKSKGLPKEADIFFDYYESNGWKVGKNPMVNWRSAIANWVRRKNESQGRLSKNEIKPKKNKYKNLPTVS